MRGVHTGGLGVVVGGLIAALLFALPASAANPPGLSRGPSQTINVASNGTTAGTCEDGNTAVAVATTSGGTAGVQITGMWTGTIGFYVRVGLLAPAGGTAAPYQVVNATPLAGGSTVTTTTGNGTWTIPVAGAQAVCIAFTTAAATGTATITVNVSPAPLASASSGGGGSSGGPVIVGTGSTGGASTLLINDSGSGGANQIKGTAGLLFSIGPIFSGVSGIFEVFCAPAASVSLGTTVPDWGYKLPTGSALMVAGPFLPGMCGGGTGISYACVSTLFGSTQVACPAAFTFQ